MTTAVSRDDHPHGSLHPPGVHSGLRGVFARRYLLKLLVQKDLKNRYQTTLLGLLWSYIKPATRFAVYLLVMGIGLKNLRDVPNFPVHLFTGLIIVHLTTETMHAGTNSIVSNRAIVRKMNVPREMLPVSTLLVSTYHTLPQYILLIAVVAFLGWSFSATAIAAGLLGFAIIMVFSLAFALLASALHVFFRDFGNVADMIAMMVMWFVPMIYPWTRVSDLGAPISTIYQFNPIAISVMLTQRCFWVPTIDNPEPGIQPDDLLLKGLVALAACLVFLYVAQRVFKRLEGRFAEHI